MYILTRITIAALVICFNLHTFGGLGAVRADTSEKYADLDRILSQVKQREKTLKTFVARFHQTRKNALLVEPLVSEGIMYFDHTGKILMKITDPQPLMLLIMDNRFIMGNPDTGQFTQKHIPGRRSIVERYLGIGQSVDTLKSTYDIQPVSPNGSTTCHLKLIPKSTNRNLPFLSIDVGINRQLRLPEYIRLNEAGGDYTAITMQFQSINTPLPEGIFSFEVPQREINR